MHFGRTPGTQRCHQQPMVPLCAVDCVILGQFGQNRLFFSPLLNEPCVHGWGMGGGLKGAAFL